MIYELPIQIDKNFDNKLSLQYIVKCRQKLCIVHYIFTDEWVRFIFVK